MKTPRTRAYVYLFGHFMEMIVRTESERGGAVLPWIFRKLG